MSSRHISFLETGRARPGPEMILRLGDALDLPLAARNQMLTQAGFAARYPARKWEAEDMAPIREATAQNAGGTRALSCNCAGSGVDAASDERTGQDVVRAAERFDGRQHARPDYS